jgi:hypothetical protein
MLKVRSANTLVAILSLVGFASTSLAATSTSVTLGGTVTSTLQVTSETATGAATLDLMSGQQIVKVADVNMSTNNEQGLTLTASSGNLSKTGGTSIAYQVTSVADGASAPAGSAFTIASGEDYTVGTTAAGAADVDLYIKYSPASLQDPGDYAGSITLTVSDNP